MPTSIHQRLFADNWRPRSCACLHPALAHILQPFVRGNGAVPDQLDLGYSRDRLEIGMQDRVLLPACAVAVRFGFRLGCGEATQREREQSRAEGRGAYV